MARRIFTSQFKESAVELVTQQKYSPAEAAASLGVNLHTLKFWLRQHKSHNGVVDAQEERDLRQRVAELERENQRLRMEREILKKAAAFFAKEQP